MFDMDWGGDNARALAGLALIITTAWALGGFKRPSLRLILGALGLQFALVLALFAVAPVRDSLFGLSAAVNALMDATQAGTSFVFGYIGGGEAPFSVTEPNNVISLAFQILPLVIVISGLSAVLWRWRVLAWLTGAFAFVFRRVFGLSGAASFAVSANIFLGMVEAPILIRPYLAKLSRSELFIVMTAGMATVAGTVLVIYAVMLEPLIPEAAGHVIAASIISCPAAVLLARLMVPPGPEDARLDVATPVSSEYASTMDALTTGVSEGLKLYLNIIAMLIAFVALAALVNAGLSLLPDVDGAPLTLQRVLGWAFAPLMWMMGVPWAEAGAAGALFGVKTALNELFALMELNQTAEALSERTRLILAYALCGFANFGSLGIMIAGLTTLAPERRGDILALSWPSLLSGLLSTVMTGCVVAALPSEALGL